jgi:hypothetical protein
MEDADDTGARAGAVIAPGDLNDSPGLPSRVEGSTEKSKLTPSKGERQKAKIW